MRSYDALYKKSFIFALIFSLLTLAACAPVPEADMSLYPSSGVELEGYGVNGRFAVFENESIRASVRHIRKDEAAPGGAFIAGLLDKDYVIFDLTIENLSGSKIIYNPAYTVLTNDSLDYRKPLDFTDLYDITGDERELSSLKGKFYDVNVTVLPGDATSRLLIFKPISGKPAKAEVAIKEIYIGTSTETMSFPFEFREDGP
ncbi:MAG: hypothetical protein Q8P48_04345 [Deltaproteobacteria bacterium]|nr:hypothetical protein [Deltaproteobacteria bacterium]